MPSLYCTRCGNPNPEDARFCSNCGTPLVVAPAEGAAEVTSTISLGKGEAQETETGEEFFTDAATVEELPEDSALLIVQRGPGAGSRFLLEKELTTAGRHPDSDIFLDDVTVSRRHAEFDRVGGRFTVRDVGSHNGTYVNRERIEEVELISGDEVQVGRFRLVFVTRTRVPGGRPEHGAQDHA